MKEVVQDVDHVLLRGRLPMHVGTGNPNWPLGEVCWWSMVREVARETGEGGVKIMVMNVVRVK